MPSITSPAPFPAIGPQISAYNIEQATVNLLQAWIPRTLVYVERTNGLEDDTLPRPTGPESYFGGDDFASWQAEDLPSLIVVCQPMTSPERKPAGYGQMFEIQVAAVCFDTESEHTVREWAGLYGVAFSTAIVQHGSLGGIVSSTRMVSSPRVAFPIAERRDIAQSVAVFHSWVDVTISDDGGETVPPGDPFAPIPGIPTVQTVNVHAVGTETP